MRRFNSPRFPSRTRLASALAVAMLALPTLPALAQARGELPRNGTVFGGPSNATISYNPGQFDSIDAGAGTIINQQVKGAIIEWGSFSIGRQDATTFNSVTFNHLIDGGVTLNRVVGFGNGPALSRIAGALTSPNGSVFLVNPAGVTFANGAVVNVGGLVASTMGIDNTAFLTGVDSGHFNFGGGDPGDVLVEAGAALMITRQRGLLALLGNNVDSQGTLHADAGSIGLVAASQVTLDPFGDGLTQFKVDTSSGGQVLVTGVLQARTLDNQRGRITLDAGETGQVGLGNPDAFKGVVLDVTGNQAGERGGDIAVHGDLVVLTGRWVAKTGCDVATGSCARLDASGNAAGGSITLRGEGNLGIGGGFDAGATETSVQLLADSTGVDGQGGRITLDNTGRSLRGPGATELYGDMRVSATGYGVDGTGGSIAVTNVDGDVSIASSPADYPEFNGDPVLAAAGGRTGGSIELIAGATLQAAAGVSLQARGGSVGGALLTQGFTLDLRGVDASAGGGALAGDWQVVSGNDLAIVHATNGFGAGNSLISDDAIAGALTTGTKVDISAQETGVIRQINIAPDVQIITKNAVAAEFSVSATGGQIIAGDFTGGANWQIRSDGAPLDVSFDALSTIGLYGGSISSNGGQINLISQASTTEGVELIDTSLDSAGGAIGLDGGIAEGAAVSLQDSTITTHGGQLALRGTSVGGAGVELNDSVLDTLRTDGGGGALAITGISQSDQGVSLIGGSVGAASTQITGTSTDGIGISVVGTTLDPGVLRMRGTGETGVLLAAATISTDASGVDIAGIGTTEGVVLTRASSIDSTGGDIVIGGTSSGDGNGIGVDGGSRIANGDANLVLRAGSVDGTALAIAGDGTIDSARLVNLRTGRSDGTGNVVDDTAAAMVLGGGFTSIASLGQIAAPDLVIGHAGHAGAITLAANLARTTNLTLQNDGGSGGIALDGAVSTGDGTLVLSSGGDIAQAAAAGITAHSLLVRAGGNVNLSAGQNQLSGDTLAGSAGGDFNYVDAGPLAIGAVSGNGVLASGAGDTIALDGLVAAGDVLVRNNAGNLTLRAGVGGRNVDLVTAGTLQNVGDVALTATGTWRVWSNTWLGEDRGGLLGSGTRPNLFNCTYGGACGVTIGGENHFIYTAQPTLALNIADATRQYGDANPAFGLTATGLVFADDRIASAAAGTPSSNAGAGSNVGSYAIDGAFASDLGYALQIDPGVLTVTPATLTYAADPRSVLLGQPLGTLSGTVTGFRNGDTLGSATTGTLMFSTDGGVVAPGSYGIYGSGLQAGNYVFVQAPSNLTALRVDFTPAAALPDILRLPPDNYLYDLNLGMAPICPAETPAGMRREQDGDTLGREWARVRSRPNLSSCVSSERENGCGDF